MKISVTACPQGKFNAKCSEFIILVAKEQQKVTYPELLPENIKRAVHALVKKRPSLLDYEKNATLVLAEKQASSKILLVSTGELKELGLDRMRRLGGSVARLSNSQEMAKPCVFLPLELAGQEGVVESLALGCLLGSYKFEEYKSKASKTYLQELNFVLAASEKYEQAFKEVQILAESVTYARDLVNQPGNVVTPTKMAEEAKQVSQQTSLSCKVIEQAEMEKLGMGALLSVAKGSVQPPKLIVLEHKGNSKSKKKLALVGKGITFDSGGISLKPSAGMEEMKEDMGGAAAVLAAMQAISRLQLPVNVVGVIPCAENMPSGEAARPGDIVKSALGKTIEIISTDAEGRMLLADAVWYADTKLKADKIIDIATLTGACLIALGETVAGLIANNQVLCDEVLAASIKTGEKCWQLPAYDEFKEYNKSAVADIKNTGGRYGGTITGGLFIGEFTEKPWVHIDIAGTSATKKTSGYETKGATGFGVRLLVETAKRFSSC